MDHRNRILIIDPDIRFARSVSRALAPAGYRVYHAPVAAALPVMYRVHPDLIMLGLAPERDESWEMLWRIRTLTDNPVIVAVSAPAPADVQTSAELGANACVERDISSADLETRVDALLSGRVPPPADPEQGASAPVSIPLRALTVTQLKQIDRALSEIGAYGEVRLFKTHGRLRIMVQVATAKIHPVPAAGSE